MAPLPRAAVLACAVSACAGQTADPRVLANGLLVLRDSYLDQPYCVVRGAGHYACTITRTSIGKEGGAGIHVEAWVTRDVASGVWNVTNLDPTNSTSYSAIAQSSPTGRLFILYGHTVNGTNVYRFTWSDDEFATFEPSVLAPVRRTAIDNGTRTGSAGTWTVDHFKTAADGSALLAFTKYLGSLNAPEEVFVLRSPDLLTVPNPADTTWITAPGGDHGIAPPGGNPSICEEGHAAPLLQQGGMYVMARTSEGYLAASQTADPTGASGWPTSTGYAQYWPATPWRWRLGLKNPRGPIALKQMPNGRWLLLFYNNANPGMGPRNPYFLSLGVESGGGITFSEPELALLDPLDQIGGKPGYPDIFADPSGAILISQTNKTDWRLNTVPQPLLDVLYQQATINTLALGGLVANWTAADVNRTVAAPPTVNFTAPAFGDGLTLGFWLRNHDKAANTPKEVLLSTMGGADGKGPGLLIETETIPVHGVLNVTISDGKYAAWVATDPGCSLQLTGIGMDHYFAVVIDASAKVMSVLVDGVFCDGANFWPQGWAWVDPRLGAVGGDATTTLAPSYTGTVLGAHVYNRFLYTSEVVGNYRAGPPA